MYPSVHTRAGLWEPNVYSLLLERRIPELVHKERLIITYNLVVFASHLEQMSLSVYTKARLRSLLLERCSPKSVKQEWSKITYKVQVFLHYILSISIPLSTRERGYDSLVSPSTLKPYSKIVT